MNEIVDVYRVLNYGFWMEYVWILLLVRVGKMGGKWWGVIFENQFVMSFSMNLWFCGYFVLQIFLWSQACYGWCTTHFGIGMRILQYLLSFCFAYFMYVCIIHVILLLTPFYVAFWMVVNHVHVCYHKQITHTSLNVNCFHLDFDASWCLWYTTFIPLYKRQLIF